MPTGRKVATRACYSPNVRLILALAAVALVVAACGSSSHSKGASASSVAPTSASSAWQSVVSGAEHEGHLLVYSSDSPAYNDAAAAAFKKAYPGITVDIVELPAPTLDPRADAEFASKATTADVIISALRSWTVEKTNTQGYLVPLTGPNVANLTPSLVMGDRTAVATTGVAYGFAYNTDKYPHGVDPATFTDPKFNHRIGTLSPENSTVVLNYDAYVKIYGSNWLKGIGANHPAIFSNQVALNQSVGSGELDVSLFSVAAVLPPGAPIAIEYPKTPLSTLLYGMATGRGANPDAGQVFINWLLSKDGQTAWSNGGVAVIPGVPSAKFTSSQVVEPDLQTIDAATLSQQEADFSKILSGK